MRTRIQRLIARIVLFFIYRTSAREMRRRGITDPAVRRAHEKWLIGEVTGTAHDTASRFFAWRRP
jgi:hypothetical protein